MGTTDIALIAMIATIGIIGIAVLPWRAHQLRRVEHAVSRVVEWLVTAILLCVYLTTGKK